jgi:phytoene synthase
MAESEADLAYLTDLVRTHDRPRYFSVLFAPRILQPDLFALYAFAVEIARIPDQVKDATLGEIRLQWWHDSLEAAVAGQGAGNPPCERLPRRSPATPFRSSHSWLS